MADTVCVDARVQGVINTFQNRYGTRPASDLCVAIAPGRVNLIGEHTDYNDGFVLPIAINRNVVVVGARRNDDQVHVYSMDMNQENHIDLSDITYDNTMRWSNYVRGVLAVLQEEGHSLPGMDMVMTGNVPQGAGLSSSAALEVGILMLTQNLAHLDIDGVSGARLCQKAENTFVGVQCGIMDQFISRLGEEEHALLIDCRSLAYSQVPWRSGTVRLLVVDTRVERGLVDSAYNQRRHECEAGVQALARHIPGIRSLRDVTVAQFEQFSSTLDPILRARCAHVIRENQRVQDAVEALKEGRWQDLGLLMYQSHESLRDDYEVSCRELDTVVEIASTVPGVYGARMTGAGFGGCAIVLVTEDSVERLQQEIMQRYLAATGITPHLLLTGAARGAYACTMAQ